MFGRRVDFREKVAQLLLKRLDLLRQQGVALFGVGKGLVLSAADDAAVGQGADIEVRIGGFPHQTLTRP